MPSPNLDGKCERCGNRLAFALAIVEMHTMDGHSKRNICGACRDELIRWFNVYKDRLTRNASQD